MSALRKQTDIARKQYIGLSKVYGFDKNEDDETINKKDKDMVKHHQLKNIISQISHAKTQFLQIS